MSSTTRTNESICPNMKIKLGNLGNCSCFRILGTLSNDDGDARDDFKKKLEFILYHGISQLYGSVQGGYCYQNLLKLNV